MAARIPKTMLAFLRDLEAHNNRDWFQDNKTRYEQEYLQPAQEFIEALREPLATVSQQLTADPARTGGTLFRIYRDTRFSKDKRPYKTHAGFWFHHAQAGRKGVGPGLYLHVTPGGSFAALGIHCAKAAEAQPVRLAIIEHPEEWGRLTAGLKAAGWPLAGESFKLVPRGLPRDHALADDLKRKEYHAYREFGDAEVTAADFADELITQARTIAPLGAFLARALDLDW